MDVEDAATVHVFNYVSSDACYVSVYCPYSFPAVLEAFNVADDARVFCFERKTVNVSDMQG
jgi:hypothetical protein